MLDALMAQSPTGFAFIDAELRLRRVSHSLAELIGTKPAEQLGRTPAEVWPAALAASAESAVRKVLETGFRTPDLARHNPKEFTVLHTAAMGQKVREVLHQILSRREPLIAV